MAGMELEGKLLHKGDVEQINETLTKRVLWLQIDLDTDYPQEIEIELIKDKCSLIDKYSVGDTIAVDVNIRGRKVTLKSGARAGQDAVFNSFNGWRIRGNASGADNAGAGTQPPPPPQDGDGDDLPF